WRTYEFVDRADGDEDEASLRETDASWRRRRGSAAPLTETEQRELRAATEGRLREAWARVHGGGGGGGGGDNGDEKA
ncbi:hypothetical protein VTH06DRAFT_7727, partial [Thermothelomyces fergusii]